MVLRTGLPIPISLAPIVWKRLVGQKRELDDLKHVDQFYFQVSYSLEPRMVEISSILQNSRRAVTLLLMFISNYLCILLLDYRLHYSIVHVIIVHEVV